MRLQVIRDGLWGMALVLRGPRRSRKPVFSRDNCGERRGAGDLHVLVEGAVSGQLGLAGAHFQVEVVDGEGDDDDEGQDEAQDEGESLFQAFPLIRDAFVGCRKSRKMKSQHDHLGERHHHVRDAFRSVTCVGVTEASTAAAECGFNLDSVPGTGARLEPLEREH